MTDSLSKQRENANGIINAVSKIGRPKKISANFLGDSKTDILKRLCPTTGMRHVKGTTA